MEPMLTGICQRCRRVVKLPERAFSRSELPRCKECDGVIRGYQALRDEWNHQDPPFMRKKKPKPPTPKKPAVVLSPKEQASIFAWADNKMCEAVDAGNEWGVDNIAAWARSRLTGKLREEFEELAEEAAELASAICRKRS